MQSVSSQPVPEPGSTSQPSRKQRLQALLDWLATGLVEREQPLRLALLSALAGEHLLLIGPPGTAKSELARRLHRAFSGGRYFERLLTRFSVPEELFGPLSIKALEQDEYLRLTEGYLPSASIAFVDEVFKANSAILNALLTLLNEREFDNGMHRLKTPLVAVIAASNELPDGDELGALYDRFLLRCEVGMVSEDGFETLLGLRDGSFDVDAAPYPIDPKELTRIASGAEALPLDEDVVQLLRGLRRYLGEQGHTVSDRRWRKAVKLLRVATYTDGRERVSVWDCWLLQHCLWDRPEQRRLVADWYQDHLGTAAVLDPQRLSRLADTWAATLQRESAAVIPLRNVAGEPLYIDADGNETVLAGHQQPASEDGEPLYLAPPDQPGRDNDGQGYTRAGLREKFFDDHYSQCHIDGHWVSLEDYLRRDGSRLYRYQPHTPKTEPVSYSDRHIRDRVAEMDTLMDSVAAYQQMITARLDELDQVVARHLWLDHGFVTPAGTNLRHSLQVAAELKARIAALRRGFAELPRNG